MHVHAADKLVFADFELPLDQRPVSSRGGWIQLFGFQESQGHPMQFKGMDGQTPPAPAIKMTAKDGSNKAIAFEYELVGPNQWGGVSVEILRTARQGRQAAVRRCELVQVPGPADLHRRADEDARRVPEPERRHERRTASAVRLSHQVGHERLQDQVERRRPAGVGGPESESQRTCSNT